MKTQETIYQPNILINSTNRESLIVYENNLHMNAWLFHDKMNTYISIYAKSPYFEDDVHVILKNNELIIQVGVKVEVEKPYWIKRNEKESYFILNSVYAIIKSSKIYLPDNSRYNLVSYCILQNGLLNIIIKRWEHSF